MFAIGGIADIEWTRVMSANDLFTEASEQTGNKRTRYSFDLIYDAIRSD